MKREQKIKPSLRACVRRFGLFYGVASWWLCRREGHDWLGVETVTLGHDARGCLHVKTKCVCRCCHAATLIHVIVWADCRGNIHAISPDVHLLEQPMTLNARKFL